MAILLSLKQMDSTTSTLANHIGKDPTFILYKKSEIINSYKNSRTVNKKKKSNLHRRQNFEKEKS